MDALESVKRRVAAAEERAGRPSGSVTLVAVSKGRSVEQVLECYDAGHRDFGENRADELVAKALALPEDIRWHFVGTLQSNKARRVKEHVHLLHSLVGQRLAERWAADPGSPPALIQVNVSADPLKHGLDPGDVAGFAQHCAGLGIEVRGLMTIPKQGTPEQIRGWFRSLARLGSQVGPGMALSMGMTDDFEIAIEEGATMIRIGRAIFDSRSGS